MSGGATHPPTRMRGLCRRSVILNREESRFRVASDGLRATIGEGRAKRCAQGALLARIESQFFSNFEQQEKFASPFGLAEDAAFHGFAPFRMRQESKTRPGGFRPASLRAQFQRW